MLFGGSQQAALTRFIRLTIYGYLSLKEILTKVASLNRFERNFLESSAIARENKTFTMELKSLKQSGSVRWAMLREREEVDALCDIPPRLVDYIIRLVA